MIQYTTPTHELLVVGRDLTGCDVWVSYTQGARQRDVKVEPHAGEEGTTLYVPWGQEDSARFREGPVDIQVNWIYQDGSRDATKTATVVATRNLLRKKVMYGE